MYDCIDREIPRTKHFIASTIIARGDRIVYILYIYAYVCTVLFNSLNIYTIYAYVADICVSLVYFSFPTARKIQDARFYNLTRQTRFFFFHIYIHIYVYQGKDLFLRYNCEKEERKKSLYSVALYKKILIFRSALAITIESYREILFSQDTRLRSRVSIYIHFSLEKANFKSPLKLLIITANLQITRARP